MDLPRPFRDAIERIRARHRFGHAAKLGCLARILYGEIYPEHQDLYDIAPYEVRKFYENVAHAALESGANSEFLYPPDREPVSIS
jgi:hypothetical protein